MNRSATAFCVLLLPLLGACWGVDNTERLDLSEVRYVNPFLPADVAAVYRTVDVGQFPMPQQIADWFAEISTATGLPVEELASCPDGQIPRFFHLRRSDSSPDAPVVLALYHDAFDYPLEFGGQATYYARLTTNASGSIVTDDSRPKRLTREWADTRARKFIGLPVDGGDGEGAAIAAFVEQGFHVIVPTNCWGDQWAGYGANLALAADGQETFARLGMLFAFYPLFLIDEGIGDLPISATNLTSRLAIYAPGDAGRGVAQMFYNPTPADPPIGYAADPVLLLDASPDRLNTLVNSSEQWTTLWVNGLARVQGLDRTAFDALAPQLSMTYAIETDGWSSPMRFVWFDRGDDTSLFRYPPASMRPLAQAINNTIGSPNGLAEQQTVETFMLSNANSEMGLAYASWLAERLNWTQP